MQLEMREPVNLKRARTKDPFVKMARRLWDVEKNTAKRFTTTIMKSKSKRVYTNGKVLISELAETPEEYDLIDLDNLWQLSKEDRFKYPPIERVIPTTAELDGVIIPEEFYELLKAFERPRPRPLVVRVEIRRDGIYVEDHRDDALLEYKEFSAPAISEAAFDFRYITAIRPRKILMDSETGPARVKSSYAKGLENCVSVLMMPMAKRDPRDYELTDD